MLQFLWSKDFEMSIEKFDKTTQAYIKEKLQFFASSENPLFHAKKLKGPKDKYRFRAGDYRIIFRLTENQIILLTAKHRKEVYRDS